MKKIGLTGCGSIGRLHAENLKGCAEILFHNRTRGRAEAFARKFGGLVCKSFEELIESADGVVIATPPSQHEIEVRAALTAGVSVLVEKPLCTEPEQLERLQDVATRHSKSVLMVAENYYYKPSLLNLKQHIVSGVLGEIKHISAKKLKTQKASGWRSAYGALIEGGIHYVALVADLLDTSVEIMCGHPQVTEADFPNWKFGQMERNAVIRLAAINGPTASIHYAWDVPSLTQGVFQHSNITGSQGQIIFESNGIYQRLKTRRRTRLEFPGFVDMSGYKAMMNDFLKSVEDPNHSPYSNFERATRDLEIVFNAYRSLKGS